MRGTRDVQESEDAESSPLTRSEQRHRGCWHRLKSRRTLGSLLGFWAIVRLLISITGTIVELENIRESPRLTSIPIALVAINAVVTALLWAGAIAERRSCLSIFGLLEVPEYPLFINAYTPSLSGKSLASLLWLQLGSDISSDPVHRLCIHPSVKGIHGVLRSSDAFCHLCNLLNISGRCAYFSHYPTHKFV
ncbi:hypothetical protein PMAYCL1PPCAC_05639 [Pristionchus mayeri]|uniref:Uncharacterized protein n=1 Tax=Pristionchus mayeri TaxID=1317129 RepID=A0AAN4Z992_9BILA|nr:hypothetical protein PMAYCL1PPCAC_05639 [Pristionchus mayeri]